jgi:tetratricopeptide (TPR) repeat protein
MLLLAACSAGGLSAPGTADGRGDAVDGLVVGHRLMAANEPELALRAYYRAAAEQGVNADVLSAIGSANLALGRLNQAEQILRRAIEEEPTFVPAINNLGVVLMELGDYGQARAVFQQAFALDSGQTDSIRQNLANAIARTDGTGYDAGQEEPAYTLMREGPAQDDVAILSEL